jgi:DnaK suppressor protein
MVNPATLQRYRKKLLELRDGIVAEGDLEIEPGRKDAAAVGTDDDAQPLTEMSQTIASTRNRARTDVLARVAVALQRMEEDPDSYGLCVECDEPISPRRLELLPYVELCVECQQEVDGAQKPGRRRHLTDYR